MGQSLSYRPLRPPWKRKPFPDIAVVVVVVIVVLGAGLALPGDRVAAFTGLFGAVANLVVLTRHGKGGAGVRSHS
ncbi:MULTISPECIES: hypothetical protein [Streptomyces]|uniref:Uncharacterized protein n=2 Tax=Streptomyces TaxID=1883 RepID=A0A939FSC3_9ACTN|nr:MULTISPECIES: hypothetical protein [Streptomyces]MBO0655132.1 hypothetical protein [Streptomyces triculaminicus]QSY51001.1 hypothetical protein J3S04_08895 [Streptomyces griseocarneus]